MVRSIVIVGGGSSGWITANILAAHFEGMADRAPQITLIESPLIPTVGVGEATVPSIRKTLAKIGLSEPDFMASTDATFKTLIRFIDWNKGEEFDHPFDKRLRPDTDEVVETWKSGQGTVAYDRAFSVLSCLASELRAPKAVNWPDYQSPFPYAYHLDAFLLAKRLTEIGISRGVQHVLANVTNVEHGEDGRINSVKTDKETEHSADLFVDCTGFRALLIGEALRVPKRNWSDALLCDRAANMNVPYDVFQPTVKAYTVAIARSSGWQWDINLRSRRGLGYVYSSAFQSAESAEAELRAAEGPHAADLPIRHIKFESTKRARSWAKNCVAIGLSDGFLEPLESSGLYMVQFAGHALAEAILDYTHSPDATRNLFNESIEKLYEEVADYLNLHYVTSTRRDTEFWRAATSREAILPSVSDRLEVWKHRAPNDRDFSSALRLFSLQSHEYLLFGMGYSSSQTGNIRQAPDLTDILAKSREKLPTQENWLAQKVPGTNV